MIGRPLIGLTLAAAAGAGCFDRLVVAAPAGRWDAIRDLATDAGFTDVIVVEGGERRQDSVGSALARAASDVVCVHDAARPLAQPALFAEVVAAAEQHRAATAAVPCVDTIKRVADGYVMETLDRSTLVATQTPQAFERALLAEAHAAARRDHIDASDDALLVERIGVRVAVVTGDPRNIKVTHPHDLAFVRALLGS